MLDLEMLELLARPPGCYIGAPPPMLEDVFAKVVADGWAPRSPCVGERELARLEQSIGRGDCLYPLLQAGDVIYVDPSTPAQSGDIVSFALSSRGTAAQNSNLPAGQSPCKPGDRWCKLMIDYRGIGPMLLERHGNSATATLMACERPDDTPVLHPVRNVRRNGRLLFAPESHASELGQNAATAPASSTYTTSTTMNSVWQTFVSVTVVVDVSSDFGSTFVTGSANALLGPSPSSPTGGFRLTLDGTAVQTPLGWNGNMAGVAYTSSFDYTTVLTPGSHTFSIQGINTSGGATFENAALSVAIMKR